jgi:hypothetical protein
LQTHVAGVGIEIYLAEHDVRPGKELSSKVQQQIEACNAVIVLLTASGADSAYVQQEIGYALKSGNPVIPLVEHGLPVQKLAMLNGKEYIELDPDKPDAALRKASEYLQRLKGRKDFIDAAMATLIIAGIIYLWSSGEGGVPSLPSA